jgi:hypothetical protein
MFVTDKAELFSWEEVLSLKSIQSEYYREININQYEHLIELNKSLYQNSFKKFEKKLLGRLNILKFKIKFLCGLVCIMKLLKCMNFGIQTTNSFIANDKSFFQRMME